MLIDKLDVIIAKIVEFERKIDGVSIILAGTPDVTEEDLIKVVKE